MIKETFAPVAIQAFTATATGEVLRDIQEQLHLQNPESHIDPVDRPNRTYRVGPRTRIVAQVADLLKRHTEEPGIINCLRRDDVDALSAWLNAHGFRNLPYHAGLDDETRRFHQEQFASEKVDIMVATIAFGRGIDRSDIRYVIYTAMPKSIKPYHQETGRAGRGRLPAHCYLLCGGSEYLTWKSLLENSPQKDVMLDKLRRLYHFCAQPQCRHPVLAKYFDQKVFLLLRQKRRELAQQQGVSAFIIFGDRSLRDMSMIKPVSRDAFAAVYGVGDQKLRAYAGGFLEVIRRYLGKK